MGCLSSGRLKRARLIITDLRDNHYTLFTDGTNAPDPEDNGPDAICFGDSGGPLIVSTSIGERVVGVVRASPANCAAGSTQSFVKVGWRGSPGNSQPHLWIIDQTS